MNQIKKISHVPIREPMYHGGVMTQAWIRFFEQLAKGVDVAEFADIITMHAKSHELPTLAVMGQLMMDNTPSFDKVNPLIMNDVPTFDTVQTPSIDNVNFEWLQPPQQELI